MSDQGRLEIIEYNRLYSGVVYLRLYGNSESCEG